MNQASGGSGGHGGPDKDALSVLTCSCCLMLVAFVAKPSQFTLEGSVINSKTMKILYEGRIKFL